MEKNILDTFLENKFDSEILTNKNDGLEEIAAPLMVKNPNLKLESLEPFLKNPAAIREERNFDDLRGFVDYVNDFKSDDTAIFASKEKIEAIFDYHKKDSPKWGKHRALYKIRASSRWGIWLRQHNVWVSQKDFAEFLDTGLNEIVSPDQSEILSLVKNFRATVSQEVESSESGAGTSFNYRKVTKGGSSITTEMTIPDFLMVRLQPFDNLEVINSRIEDEKKKIPAYEFKAKINWRLEGDANDSQSIEFKIQILNVEQEVDKTLEIIRGAVSHLTDAKTYIG